MSDPASQTTGPRIASHHKDDPWRPIQPWTSAVTVQWGGHGIVFSKPENYRTAFFEAFPADGSAGFIRGEGETLEAAEEQAFAKWDRNLKCFLAGGHRWSRALRQKNGKVNTYTNGGCFCLRCGSFQTAMAPIVSLGDYKKPLSATDLDSIASGYCRPSPWSKEDERDKRWRRRNYLRAKLAGIDMPTETPRDPAAHPFEPDEYEVKCQKAVASYIRSRPELLDGGSDDLFSSIHKMTLKRLVVEDAENA